VAVTKGGVRCNVGDNYSVILAIITYSEVNFTCMAVQWRGLSSHYINT